MLPLSQTAIDHINRAVQQYKPHNSLEWHLMSSVNKSCYGEFGVTTVNVTYTGSFDIGKKTVHVKNLSNNEINEDLEKFTRLERNCCVPDENPASWHEIASLFLLIVTIPCGIGLCIRRQQWEKYNEKLHSMLLRRRADEIIEIIKKADAEVNQRIEEIAKKAGVSPSPVTFKVDRNGAEGDPSTPLLPLY